MEVLYASKKVEQQCTSVKAAKKLFGGDTTLATSLLARVNALREAETIKDIIVQPLNNDKLPFQPCYIDQIADSVKIIEITEVSKHYE